MTKNIIENSMGSCHNFMKKQHCQAHRKKPQIPEKVVLDAKLSPLKRLSWLEA